MIKASDKTPILLIGVLIVTIAGIFFSPWRDGWDFYINYLHSQMYSIKDGQPSTPDFFELHILPFFMYLLMPVFMEIADFMGYASIIIDMMENNELNVQYIFICVIRLGLYIVVNHFLEKYHGKLHDEENILTVCIDMICIENIVIYLMNIICYIISLIVKIVAISDIVLGVLILILAIPVGLMAVCMILYYIIGLLISALPPILIMDLVQRVLGNSFVVILEPILMIVFSQIIWRFLSNHIYNWWFGVVTSHNFED